ncbi:acyl carrier protein [Methylocaldum sp.]|uniref:acyl carrier protein n=1 Tax=Methylocaldum sp. TaxID=1969727 RepID=UPI002D6D3A65|nr:acyl carrier protein [Methylocaldum sp.]HYE35748.1 acyl carrier protein [Methylocaldum sp.]
MHQDAYLLAQAVTRLFAAHLNIEVPEPDTDLMDGGFLDSLLLVNLIVALEREFGVSVSIDDLDLNLENFRTVSQIAAYIERYRNLSDVDAA